MAAALLGFGWLLVGGFRCGGERKEERIFQIFLLVFSSFSFPLYLGLFLGRLSGESEVEAWGVIEVRKFGSSKDKGMCITTMMSNTTYV
eukprot:1102249-Amorphochlora_amoeboformis.AAC.1